MFGLGIYEILAVAALFMLLFGGSRFKSLMTGLGESIKEVRKSASEMREAEKEIKK